MRADYDAIIVGSGPAGATAAYFLGQAGWNVLVLEKETLPRYKTCGGGISLSFLKTVFPFSFDEVVESTLEGMTYDYKSFSASVPFQKGIVGMVMRSRFDAFILEHANVEVREGTGVHTVVEMADRVAVETDAGEEFTARYLIGADGANSVVAHSLGLRSKKSSAAAIEVEVEVPPSVQEKYASQAVFIFGELRLGYMWIFPKDGHLSVGLAAMKPRHRELKDKLRQTMKKYGISLEGAKFHGHPIPLYSRNEKIATQRCFLVGDAAGLVDPFSGEGIRYAIKSGRLIAGALLSGQAEQYQKLVYRQIGFNHMLARYVAQFFYHFQGLCLVLGAPNPFTTQAIVELLSDRAATVEVMLWAILTLPVYAGTELVALLAGVLKGPERAARIRQAVYTLPVIGGQSLGSHQSPG
jgi:geranylgeranyl reductase family protein